MGKTNRRKLGRGLGALLPESNLEENFRYLSVDAIQPNPYQVREVEDVDDLIPSIKEHGIIQPLLVRKKNGSFILVAGARRLKAAKELKMEKVPVYILSIGEKEALALTLVENLKREDLNPIEVAEGYRRLIEEFGLTHEEVARIFGRDRSTITNSLRLLKLTGEVKGLIKQKALQEGHARLLLGLEDSEQIRVAREVVKKELSVRDTEILIRKLKNSKTRRKSAPLKVKSELLDVDVYVHSGKRGGKIVIKYRSREEYEKLKKALQIGG